jgi:hypothetical protein
MTPRIEKRLLQIVIALACLLPLIVGAESIVRGPAAVGGPATVPADLDSHFRYLSGIFFALGLAFVSCIPAIEARGPRFRLLGALVIAGGLARLVSLLAVGPPSTGHLAGLGVELVLVPLLLLWQASLAGRWKVAYGL